MKTTLTELLKEKNYRVSIFLHDDTSLSGFFSSFDNGTLSLRTENGEIKIDKEKIEKITEIRISDVTSTGKNPFAHVGKAVSGALFVGRKTECNRLWERAIENKCFTQIVGLPRMGKSSIVKECLITKRKELLKNHKILLIDKESYEQNALSFWKQRIINICESVEDLPIHRRKQKSVRELCKIRHKIKSISNYDVIHDKLCKLLNNLRTSFGYTVLFLFDEFDRLQYPEDKSCYRKLRELATNYCIIVTASRRPVEVIERQAGYTPYLYNLHPQPIYVGVFSKEDIDLYWQKYESYLPLSKEQLQDYKQSVDDYVGGHPFLMDTMNYITFHIRNNYEKEKDNIKKQLRIKLENEIKNQMKYVEQQGLEESAKKLLLGAEVYKEDNEENNATLLQNYSFLKYVPSSQKEMLLGSQVGPLFENGQMAYICFSDFATFLFYNIYTKQLSYADKLFYAEMGLRRLVKKYLTTTYGPDCFDTINSSLNNYEEKWESQMRIIISPYYRRKWDETINAAKISRKNQLNFETISVPNDNRCLVDFASLGQIQHLFLNKDWIWFKTIFGESNMRTWMSSVFDKICKLRNSKDHLQMFYISDSQLEDCTHACDIFLEKVDNYFAS